MVNDRIGNRTRTSVFGDVNGSIALNKKTSRLSIGLSGGIDILGYDFSSVIGHELNISKAKTLLAKAGYPNGKGLPIIKFAVGKGNTSVRVALEIQKQLLANLNVNVEISSLFQKEIIALNDSSQTNMSLSGWLAEFPDPVSFLSICYGGSVPKSINESAFPNESRFKNTKFDQL